MYLNYAIIKGYKRLSLGNIHEIEFRPKSPFQLILGTNGSGKSSFMYELSPLPGLPESYTKGGFKKVSYSYNDSEYLLCSDFGHPVKHSFIKDGNEMNPGGTAAVQKELVRSEFGYTIAIHDLLTGLDNFTGMSVAERRTWLTRLNETDVTYGTKVYGRVTSAARNAKGARVNLEKRLLSEQSKQLTPEAVLEMSRVVDTLRKDLVMFMEAKHPSGGEYSHAKSSRERLLVQIQALAQRILEMRSQRPENTKEQRLLTKEIEQHRTKLVQSMERRKSYSEEYGRLQKVQQEAALLGRVDVEDLTAKIAKLKAQTFDWVAGPDAPPIVEPLLVRNDFREVYETVLGILHVLPDNINKEYTGEHAKQLTEKIRAVQISMEKILNLRGRAEKTHEDMLAVHKQDCPNCHHQWIPGYSEQTSKRLVSEMADYDRQYASAKDELFTLETTHQKCTEWLGIQAQLRDLARTYPRLKRLWIELASNPFFYTFPQELANVLSEWNKMLNALVAREERDIELGQLEAALAAHHQQLSVAGDHFIDRMAWLERAISEELTIQETVDADLLIANQALKYREELLAGTERLVELYNDYMELAVKDSVFQDNLYLSEKIREIQSRLALQEVRLSEQTSLDAVLTSLNENLHEVSADEEVLNLIGKILSPVDGIIADSMTGFIRAFVASMNEVIADVWGYPLVVIPCGIESGELDYRFPLEVGEAEENCKDVRRASDGQKEIINFAFRLIAMVYLDLTEFPIYMDEFGARFDEKHKADTISLIKGMVESKQCSQLFMISHDPAYHNAFTHAEICVLDASHVTISKRHNEHVIINGVK